jgi:hypothetical protein
MLARCLEREDYALAAEVLLAWPLTGESWSAAAAFGFRVVMGARDAGLGRSFQAEIDAAYAAGMLCAACLAPGRRPPVRVVSASAGRAGSFAAVLARMDGVDARWMVELDRMEAAEQEALAEFVLGIGLQRGFQRWEFGAMERLLSVAKGLRLGSSPVAVQAGEMMGRVASCGLVSPAAPVQTRREEIEVYELAVLP